MKKQIHNLIGGVVAVSTLALLCANAVFADVSSERLETYKANKLLPANLTIDSTSTLSNLSFSNLQWKVANANQALLDRFAGFTGLTYDEWAALEDSEDKWLFYLLCYNRYFPNSASYADCKSNRESMMDALNYLGSNTTTIPDGVVINDTSVYAIPGTLWMSNPEHFGQGAVDVSGFYDIDAGLFTRVPDGAQLSIIHGGIVGVTAENADMVISKLSNAVDTTITIADGATISVAQYAALQNAIVVYSSNPPELGGNYSVTKVSESDNLSGIRNWTKLTGIPDSQYAKMDSIEKCSGKSFTSEQWQKILPNIKAKKGSYDDYGNEPSDIMIHGTYATWGEAGLAD